MTIIRTDRSRIETHERCPRKRFWQYEYQGRGLEKGDNLALDARIGTWVHWGIEYGLEIEIKDVPGPSYKDAAVDAGIEFMKDCKSVIDWDQASDQLKHDIFEGGEIVTALVYAWLRVKAPRLLQDGEVLGIEKELTVDFDVAGQTVRIMARPDIIWRRNTDGTIFIRNLKTVRKADDRWREKWALDQQTLSEPLAVDGWLKSLPVGRSEGSSDEASHRLGEQDTGNTICGGVIIDGLVTGEVLFDKYRGLFYHNNPLIYAWMGGDVGVVDKPVFYPRYEWSCTGPHKFANGRKCEGGRTHKLSGVRKVSVAEKYPGGIIAWVDYLVENDLPLIEEMIVELPPIIRSEYQIERWKRQALPREVRIKHDAEYVQDERVPDHYEERIDLCFPMHTSNGNCVYPSKCVAFDLCHGSAAVDPLNSGYRFRVPNHPEEGESE